MNDRVDAQLTPLVRALFEEVREGVIVFDLAGRQVYANALGRVVVRQVGADGQDRSSALPKLSRVGSRIAPIWVGGMKVCEVVLVPAEGGAEEGDPHTLADREREAILETLRSTGGKLTESARRLGISRTTLWRRLREYGIDRGGRSRWSRPS